MQGTTWSELELDLERSKAYTRLDTQNRTSNERFAFMNKKDYRLRFNLISKTNVKDILEIKYPMLTLIQIKLYLKKSVYRT
jgi:hypothetical protein